jgi:diguanylate cyclase (GGDEF)-like protein
VSGESSVPFFMGMIVTAGVLIPMLLRLRASVSEARSEAEAATPRLQSLRRANARLQEDLGFLTHFLKDFPRQARELYNNLGERQVPQVLLTIIQRSLDPQQVAIMVRGSEKPGAKVKEARFVVTAAYPDGAAIKKGEEISAEGGEIGFAAESQMVLTRKDLEAEEALNRMKPGASLPGLPKPELIAPLVFDQETLGVILVGKPRKSGDPKAALRLVAQTGAQVLHTAAQVSRIKHTAEMDGLTRVFNKKHMEQMLNELVYRAACAAYDKREGTKGGLEQKLSIFLFDIDNFKHYNDTNGHLAGDMLLQELAQLVRQSVRKDDVVGRFGGEEFLLILPNTNFQQALVAAEKVRTLIANHPFPHGEKQPNGRLSISGGVAAYPLDGLDAPGMLSQADKALYVAKRQGRNKVIAAADLPTQAEATASRASGAGEAARP